jgi:hypothetical protein
LEYEELQLQNICDDCVSYGTLISALHNPLQLRPSTLAKAFRGFPMPGRVHIIMPDVLPWMFPMLPHPDHIRHVTPLKEALPLMRRQMTRLDKTGFQNHLDAVMRKCRKGDVRASLKLSNVVLLWYQGEAAQFAHWTMCTQTSEYNQLIVTPTESEQRAAMANQRMTLAFNVQELDRCLKSSATLLLQRAAVHARLCLASHLFRNTLHGEKSVANERVNDFATHICYEGNHRCDALVSNEPFHLNDNSHDSATNKSDINMLAAGLDWFIHLGLEYTRLKALPSLLGDDYTQVASYDGNGGNGGNDNDAFNRQLRQRQQQRQQKPLTLRQQIFQSISTGIRLMQQQAAMRAINNPAYVRALSPYQVATFKYGNQLPITKRWIEINMSHYGNLTPQGTVFAWLAHLLVTKVCRGLGGMGGGEERGGRRKGASSILTPVSFVLPRARASQLAQFSKSNPSSIQQLHRALSTCTYVQPWWLSFMRSLPIAADTWPLARVTVWQFAARRRVASRSS